MTCLLASIRILRTVQLTPVQLFLLFPWSQSQALNTFMSRLFWQYQQCNGEICCMSKASSTICSSFRARQGAADLHQTWMFLQQKWVRKGKIMFLAPQFLTKFQNKDICYVPLSQSMTQTDQDFFFNTPNYNIFFWTFWFVAIKKSFNVICSFNLEALVKIFSKVQDGYLAKETWPVALIDKQYSLVSDDPLISPPVILYNRV